MSNDTINTNLSRAEVIAALQALPQGMTGGSEAARRTLIRIGLAMLRIIHGAFIVKMHGGTDDAGDRWAPLSPVTVARRRKKREKREEVEDLPPIVGGVQATAHRRARSIIKGSNSSYNKYSRDSEILHDSGLLLESLRPGSFSAEQIFEIADGHVIVGTRREGAEDHHAGRPDRNPPLPQRKLWPDPGDWPTHWWDQITSEVQSGLVDLLIQEIEKQEDT